MKRKLWSVIALALIMAAVLFAAACNKEVVQTQSASTVEPEVQKAPDIPAEETERDAQLMDRLRTEAATRETADAEFVKENVHFDFDSAILSDEARKFLNSMADYLRTNPDMTIIVEGHCDDRGTNEYNIALGERRAEAVRMYLSDLGIVTNRLKTISYGEERPVAVGNNEAAWAQNRRAEFIVN